MGKVGNIVENGYCLAIPQPRHAPPESKNAASQQADHYNHPAPK
jgi:hypothetical protein